MNRLTWVHTPSTASTRTSAPSHSRDAVETSLEKSTWPGVSIRLILYSSSVGSPPAIDLDRQPAPQPRSAPGSPSTSDTLGILHLRLTAEDSIVIPRSCSSSRLSR